MRGESWFPLRVYLVGVALATVLAFGIVPACTVAPKPVEAAQPSLDGNVANSGLIGDLPDGSGVLTATAIERYEGLIALGYGKGYVPALKPGVGYKPLPDGTYTLKVSDTASASVFCAGDYQMDGEHVADFGWMATAHRLPKKT